jgi:hypothetical protein
MNRSTRLKAFGAVAVMGGLGWSCANAAEDPTCKLVFDAMAKAVLTANHQYLALKMDALNGGKPRNSEIINTGKASYIKSDGKWKPSVPPQAMLEQMVENRKNAKSTCHLVRDESIDGSPASLYAVREGSSDDSPTDSKVWLAKANGLPIHVEMDMEGMHSETRYVYGAVSAPPLN